MDERPAKPDPKAVSFSETALAEYREILGHYPQRRAALMPVLWLAQREFGWISKDVMAYLAELMELPIAWVEGAVTFYTMYYTPPDGAASHPALHQPVVPPARSRRSDVGTAPLAWRSSPVKPRRCEVLAGPRRVSRLLRHRAGDSARIGPVRREPHGRQGAGARGPAQAREKRRRHDLDAAIGGRRWLIG